MKQNEKQGVYSPVFVKIALISLITFTCVYCMNNGLPLYVTGSGGSGSLAGSITAVCSLTAVIGRIASGVMSDCIGRRPLLICGTAAIAMLFVLPVLITEMGFLLVFMSLFGILWSTVTTAASAAAADLLPNGRMGEGMGFFSLGQAIAMAIGPALASWLLGGGDAALMFSCMIGVSAFSFILALSSKGLRFTPRPKNERAPFKPSELIYKDAIPLSAAMLFFRVSAALMLSFVSMYAESEGIPNSRLFFLVEAGAMVLTRLFAGKLIDRYKPNYIFIPAILIGALSFFMLCPQLTFTLLMASAVCYGLSLGTVQPLINTLIIRKAEPMYYGRATSTYILFMDIGTAVGAFLWGKVLDISSNSYPLIFAGGGVFLLLCGLLGTVINSRDK